MKRRLLLAGLIGTVVMVLFGIGAVYARQPLAWLMPIDHTGKVLRIAEFSKGGLMSRTEDTRQLRQFAIIFDDGFDCEGVDTSFAAVREGDVITVRGYHDVKGTPFLDPEWWECDEAQLVRLHPPAEALR